MHKNALLNMINKWILNNICGRVCTNHIYFCPKTSNADFRTNGEL